MTTPEATEMRSCFAQTPSSFAWSFDAPHSRHCESPTMGIIKCLCVCVCLFDLRDDDAMQTKLRLDRDNKIRAARKCIASYTYVYMDGEEARVRRICRLAHQMIYGWHANWRWFAAHTLGVMRMCVWFLGFPVCVEQLFIWCTRCKQVIGKIYSSVYACINDMVCIVWFREHRTALNAFLMVSMNVVTLFFIFIGTT